MPAFLSVPGDVVEPERLSLRRAAEVAAAVAARGSFASLVECRSTADAEVVVFDVEVERPQHPVCDIRRVERVASRLRRGDDSWPEALALRDDFPVVPHLNMRDAIRPRSLCLYDRSWDEVRPSWTGASFLERVRWWLARTARGDLHEGDQPLEPLMFSHGFDLVVSSRFGQDDGPASETARVALVDGREGRVFVAEEEDAPNRGGQPCVVLYIETPARTHGVIQRTPKTVRDLAEMLDTDDFRLADRLRRALRGLPGAIRGDPARRRELRPLFVLGLPKTRQPGGAVEAVELKGFLCLDTVEAAGARIDAWEVVRGEIGQPLTVDPQHDGSDVGVIVVNVVRRMTWDRAASYSGLARRDDRKIVAVGLGALGSQVAMNLARGGFGQWTLIDHDAFLPHNVVRHALEGGFTIGHKKASCVAHYMNTLADDVPLALGIPANYLYPGADKERTETAVSEADLVLDMSASVPVARAIATDTRPCQAMSVFLSPGGRDLVLLAEGTGRSVRLDDLEMLYYGAVATTDSLRGHLVTDDARARYGTGCRDVSVQMAQAPVATHAGIAASAIMQNVGHENATARVWRLDPVTMGVRPIEIPVEPFLEHEQHGWHVRVRRGLFRDVSRLRKDRAPNETGGILVGGVDHEARCVHLVLALPSPPDSEEWPRMYIRGVRGLREARERIVEETAGNLDYLGEWHSHPTRGSTTPSEDDRKVFRWIAELVGADGRPPLMLIVGDDDARVYVDRLEEAPPEPLCLP